MRAILFIVISATAALSGCAAYEKCGFTGCPGDVAIRADVQALFSQHPVLEPPNQVRVQVIDRVVYLTGIVDTDLERSIATDVAGEAPGVARVVSSIGLSGGR